MFKLIHNNKKGFSLVELLITIVILGFVCALTGQLSFQIWRLYNETETRWEVQNAVSLATRKFETNRDSIVNAYEADLLYDPVIEEGITVKSNTDFEWKSSRAPYIVPSEGDANHKVDGSYDDPYTYIFSAPAFDENGNKLGRYLFIRNFGEAKSQLFLDAEGMGDVPVEIKFRIAQNLEKSAELYGKEYLKNTIEIEMKSGLPEISDYGVVTQYSLANVEMRKDDINKRNNAYVCDLAWLNADRSRALAGPAGYTDPDVLNFPKNPDETDPNVYGVYKLSDKKYKEAVLTTLEKEGNVMRFISPEAYKTIADADNMTSGANMASCLTTYAFSDPSKLSSHVLGSLRDFRDNVLEGNVIGEWVIDEYYNTVSPFLIENAPELKPIYRAVLIPVSFVCGIVANT